MAGTGKFRERSLRNSNKKGHRDSNFQKLDKDFMDNLIVMHNRKLFSKVDIKEVLIDEERIRDFEELGEVRLKEERRPAEMTLKE